MILTYLYGALLVVSLLFVCWDVYKTWIGIK